MKAAVTLALLGGCFMIGEGQEPSHARKSIELVTPKKVFPLGGSIPIGIRYTNRSAAAIHFREPAKTWEVQLTIGTVALPFGRILRSQEGSLVDWSVEPAETIDLAPGAQHSFQYDAGKRWPDRFVIGANPLQVNDLTEDNAHVASNRTEVTVAFTAESVPALLAIVEDPQAEAEAKSWAEKWLKRLHPQYAGPAEMRTWWARNSQSQEVDSAVAAINRSPAKP